MWMGFDLLQELAQNDYARILHVSMSSALRRSLTMLFHRTCSDKSLLMKTPS